MGMTLISLYDLGIRAAEIQSVLLNLIASLKEKQSTSPTFTPSFLRDHKPVQMVPNKVLHDWTVSSVCDWLALHGLGEYCQAFFQQEIQGQDLATMDFRK